jgi:DNA-binding transcriptional LysR family regulator
VSVDGPLIANTIDLIRDAALDGVGLAYLPLDQVEKAVKAGRLRHVLAEWTPPLSGIIFTIQAGTHHPHSSYSSIRCGFGQSRNNHRRCRLWVSFDV